MQRSTAPLPAFFKRRQATQIDAREPGERLYPGQSAICRSHTSFASRVLYDGGVEPIDLSLLMDFDDLDKRFIIWVYLICLWLRLNAGHVAWSRQSKKDRHGWASLRRVVLNGQNIQSEQETDPAEQVTRQKEASWAAPVNGVGEGMEGPGCFSTRLLLRLGGFSGCGDLDGFCGEGNTYL